MGLGFRPPKLREFSDGQLPGAYPYIMLLVKYLGRALDYIRVM